MVCRAVAPLAGQLDAWRAAIRPSTRLLFGETLGNPGLDVLDIPAVADIAHRNGLLRQRSPPCPDEAVDRHGTQQNRAADEGVG